MRKDRNQIQNSLRQFYSQIAKILGLIILISGLFFSKGYAQQSVYTEYEIKAALIFGFIQHISLSEPALNRAGNKIRIGILGDDPFGTMIDDMFRGRQVQKGKTIEIIRAGSNGSVKNLASCQVIFVASSEADKMLEIINFATTRDMLTISDRIPAFCARGGIINFTGKKEEFEINLEVAKANGMVVSSQLLKLIQSKP